MELPVSFADYTRTLLGDEDYKELVTSLESEQSVSIRLNPLKPFAFRSGEHAVPWCTSGFYLEERPTFTFDPLFHAGCCFFSLFRWDRAVLPVYNRCRIFFAQKRALEYGL